MSRELRSLAAFALCGSSLQGCATANLVDYCKGAGLAKADSSALGLVLGAPTDRFTEPPFAAFYSPSEAEPIVTLRLHLRSAAVPWPDELDETPCKGLDWRTFRVTVEPEQWTRFWSMPRPMPFEGGIGLNGSMAPLRMAEFGFAFVDLATGKSLMSCGCYWT